ncbi:MAG: extracellular solute-binding protein [Clostridia bacterium]|nr:extracellular solute-binding protein [Clostridia bacterium]
MRMKTPVDKETVRHHITYSSWKYILMAVLVVMGWSLIYTTTAYRSPQNKRIDVYIQSNIGSSDLIDSFMEPVWKATVPEMETVSSVVLTTVDDYTTTMQLMAYMAAGEADIYFLSEQYFKSYASQGAFLSLDDLVANGALELDDVDLTKGYVAYVEEYDENDLPVKISRHLYGIPLESFYGFMSGMQIDNRALYAVITLNNQNDENVIPFFNALLQAGRGEQEGWMTEQTAPENSEQSV